MELLRVKDEQLLPFGVPIQYHHRAGVARFKKRADDDSLRKGWVITEGIAFHNEIMPAEHSPFNLIESDGMNIGDNRVKYYFYYWPQSKMGFYAQFDGSWIYQSYNKTVMIWPEDGFGWLIGKIRKSVGVSERQAYTHASYYMDADYEAGGHSSDMMVDLYVIKRQYEGTNFILCPWWAVMQVKEDA